MKFQKRTPEISHARWTCATRSARDAVGRDDLPRLPLQGRVRAATSTRRSRATPRARASTGSPRRGTCRRVDFLEELDVVAHKVASASRHRHRAARGAGRDRQADHPVDRHVDDRADRPRRGDARHRQAGAHARHLHLPAAARGGEPAHDHHPARALPACRSATRATSAACRSRSPPSRSAPSPSSATSPSTARCGAPTTPPRSSRTGSSLVRDIRIIEEALGDGVKRVFPGELAPLSRLRRDPDTTVIPA